MAAAPSPRNGLKTTRHARDGYVKVKTWKLWACQVGTTRTPGEELARGADKRHMFDGNATQVRPNGRRGPRQELAMGTRSSSFSSSSSCFLRLLLDHLL